MGDGGQGKGHTHTQSLVRGCRGTERRLPLPHETAQGFGVRGREQRAQAGEGLAWMEDIYGTPSQEEEEEEEEEK